ADQVAITIPARPESAVDGRLRPGLTLVLLVTDPRDARWHHRSGPVLAVDADAAEIHQAIVSARPGLRRIPPILSASQSVPLKPADRPPSASVGGVIAVTGGAGSPG